MSRAHRETPARLSERGGVSFKALMKGKMHILELAKQGAWW